MARKALIETATGKVLNVIELEDGANWQPPMGHYVREAGNANPGDTWDGTKFIPRPPSPEEIANQKREAAKTKAIQAILTNKGSSPWGAILYDLAVAQGWIEAV